MVKSLQKVNTSSLNPQADGTARQTFAALGTPGDFSDGVLDRIRDGMKNTEHRAKSLITFMPSRTHFDPTNKEDRIAYAIFLKTGRWTRRFYNEWPSTSIPSTIERKIIAHALLDVEKRADERIHELGFKFPIAA